MSQPTKHWLCPQCGLQVPLDAKDVSIRCACKFVDRDPHRRATLWRRGRRYASAVVRWLAAGRPERGAAEVARIYEDLCRPCERFDGGSQSCTACGCKIRRDSGALRNKIAMRTESCPLAKW
jgi:hypothetical protein